MRLRWRGSKCYLRLIKIYVDMCISHVERMNNDWEAPSLSKQSHNAQSQNYIQKHVTSIIVELSFLPPTNPGNGSLVKV